MNLIIDGYNLIFQCGLVGRSADSLALERARTRLVNELARFIAANKSATKGGKLNCTVVFDAKQRPLNACESEFDVRGVRVMYAADFEEADALIEVLIRQHSTPKKLVVVSSDHRLHKAAKARRATPIDSDTWYERNIESPPTARQSNSESVASPQLSADETAALACKFQMSNSELEQLIQEIDSEPDTEATADELGLEQDLIEELDGELDQLNPFPPGYGQDLLD